MSNLLVRLLGHRATVMHADTMVLDRWRWLKARLPVTRNRETVLDIGCGSGAFSIGLARRGYQALGLSWDERNQSIAAERAAICGAESASFEVQDVRTLDQRPDLVNRFDIIICCENIEHILDDDRLMKAMAACLKPGGRLLLTTPNEKYIPLGLGDAGPFNPVEDGGHVRRGYSKSMLRELCQHAGLTIEAESYCSGPISQWVTRLYRFFARGNSTFAWLAILLFRPAPILLDRFFTWFLNWPGYSIAVEAVKPRTPIERELAHGKA